VLVPVTPSYLTYVLDQLAGIDGVAARRMFGGVGLYQADLFFGAVDDDTVYLRVDDTSRVEYIKRGMAALRPVKRKPDMVTEAYYQLPPEVLDDADELRDWVRQAVLVARVAPNKSKVRARAALPAPKPRATSKSNPAAKRASAAAKRRR
jgi:DNA transformation protein